MPMWEQLKTYLIFSFYHRMLINRVAERTGPGSDVLHLILQNERSLFGVLPALADGVARVTSVIHNEPSSRIHHPRSSTDSARVNISRMRALSSPDARWVMASAICSPRYFAPASTGSPPCQSPVSRADCRNAA